jgi:hypothetical protein
LKFGKINRTCLSNKRATKYPDFKKKQKRFYIGKKKKPSLNFANTCLDLVSIGPSIASGKVSTSVLCFLLIKRKTIKFYGYELSFDSNIAAAANVREDKTGSFFYIDTPMFSDL